MDVPARMGIPAKSVDSGATGMTESLGGEKPAPSSPLLAVQLRPVLPSVSEITFWL